jgi:hypothetical protein
VLGSLVGAVTQKAGFEFKIWNAEVMDSPANVDAKTRLRTIEVTNRCNYDAVNTKFVTATCWNLVASY